VWQNHIMMLFSLSSHTREGKKRPGNHTCDFERATRDIMHSREVTGNAFYGTTIGSRDQCSGIILRFSPHFPCLCVISLHYRTLQVLLAIRISCRKHVSHWPEPSYLPCGRFCPHAMLRVDHVSSANHVVLLPFFTLFSLV